MVRSEISNNLPKAQRDSSEVRRVRKDDQIGSQTERTSATVKMTNYKGQGIKPPPR
jgi:hypothetical protein